MLPVAWPGTARRSVRKRPFLDEQDDRDDDFAKLPHIEGDKICCDVEKRKGGV